MDLADLGQGVIIDMNGHLDHQPKYVGTSKKVDAGMVNAAGKCFPSTVGCNQMQDDMHSNSCSSLNILCH